MHNKKLLSWVVVICFGLQMVAPYPSVAGVDGYLSPSELRIAESSGFVPTSSSIGDGDINFTNLNSENNQVTVTISAETLQNLAAEPVTAPPVAAAVPDVIAAVSAGVAAVPEAIVLPEIVTAAATVVSAVPDSIKAQDTPTLTEQWEASKEQYGWAAPLMMIGAVTNPIIESITGIEAGSEKAKEVGEDIYKWTGGLFNVPMVTLFGKSLSDTDSTDSMSLEERGQYLAEHPLEVLEYGAAVYGGAGLISGGGAAAVESTETAVKGIMANEGVSSLSQGASLVKLAYGPLAAAAKPILALGTVVGFLGYKYNDATETYEVGTDESGNSIIVDSEGNPEVLDGFSALAYSMGAKYEHIFTGDPETEAFSNAMYAQSVSSNLSSLAKDLGTNEDGSINWAGKIASIPVQAVNAPFAFAEFPLSYLDNIGNAQRKGWSEADGDLGKGLIDSSIYTGQAIGGTALGMYSFAGDVLVAGPVNFVDAVTGGDGKVLQANWLGETTANAPYIEGLGLGQYFNPIDPAKAEYPNIDYTIAMTPYLFNLRDSTLGSDATRTWMETKPGFLGRLVNDVELLKGIALKPVDVLTLPLNAGLEKAGSGIIGLSNDIHNQGRTQGQADLVLRMAQNTPPAYDFVKDAPILGYQITSGEFADIPDAIRSNMGAVDQTTYTREFLQKNIGSVIALQMNGDKADFYIIDKPTFDQKYRVVPSSEVGAKNSKLVNKLVTVPGMKEVVGSDSNLVGALKEAPVKMIRLSELGYDVNTAVTIKSPWGEQTKPAGQDAFLTFDAAAGEFYMVNTDASGNPISYVVKKG